MSTYREVDGHGLVEETCISRFPQYLSVRCARMFIVIEKRSNEGKETDMARTNGNGSILPEGRIEPVSKDEFRIEDGIDALVSSVTSVDTWLEAITVFGWLFLGFAVLGALSVLAGADAHDAMLWLRDRGCDCMFSASVVTVLCYAVLSWRGEHLHFGCDD